MLDPAYECCFAPSQLAEYRESKAKILAIADKDGKLPIQNNQRLPLAAITGDLLVLKNDIAKIEYLFMKSITENTYKARLLRNFGYHYPIPAARQKEIQELLKLQRPRRKRHF